MEKEHSNKEIVATILKPDAVREFLDMPIISDIESSGLNIRSWISLNIPKELVQYIYPEKKESPVFDSTISSLTSGPSILLLVEGDDSHKKMSKIKGNWDTGGIRRKYRRYSKDELIVLGYEGKNLQDKLFENRIHTTDSQEESDKLFSLLLTRQQLEGLKKTNPDLYSRIKKYTEVGFIDQNPLISR